MGTIQVGCRISIIRSKASNGTVNPAPTSAISTSHRPFHGANSSRPSSYPTVSHVREPEASRPERVEGVVFGAVGMIRRLRRRNRRHRLAVDGLLHPAVGHVEGVDHVRAHL